MLDACKMRWLHAVKPWRTGPGQLSEEAIAEWLPLIQPTHTYFFLYNIIIPAFTDKGPRNPKLMVRGGKIMILQMIYHFSSPKLVVLLPDVVEELCRCDSIKQEAGGSNQEQRDTGGHVREGDMRVPLFCLWGGEKGHTPRKAGSPYRLQRAWTGRLLSSLQKEPALPRCDSVRPTLDLNVGNCEVINACWFCRSRKRNPEEWWDQNYCCQGRVVSISPLLPGKKQGRTTAPPSSSWCDWNNPRSCLCPSLEFKQSQGIAEVWCCCSYFPPALFNTHSA